MRLHPKQLGDAVLVQLGADDAQAAGVVGRAAAHFGLTGDEVEVDPLALESAATMPLARSTVPSEISPRAFRMDSDLLLGVLVRGLAAPALEDLVGVVVAMMIVVVAAAGAALAVRVRSWSCAWSWSMRVLVVVRVLVVSRGCSPHRARGGCSWSCGCSMLVRMVVVMPHCFTVVVVHVRGRARDAWSCSCASAARTISARTSADSEWLSSMTDSSCAPVS